MIRGPTAPGRARGRDLAGLPLHGSSASGSGPRGARTTSKIPTSAQVHLARDQGGVHRGAARQVCVLRDEAASPAARPGRPSRRALPPQGRSHALAHARNPAGKGRSATGSPRTSPGPPVITSSPTSPRNYATVCATPATPTSSPTGSPSPAFAGHSRMNRPTSPGERPFLVYPLGDLDDDPETILGFDGDAWRSPGSVRGIATSGHGSSSTSST